MHPMSFPEKHPWMTFFLGIFALGAVVNIAYAASPAVQKLAGAAGLKKNPLAGAKSNGAALPPKTVA